MSFLSGATSSTIMRGSELADVYGCLVKAKRLDISPVEGVKGLIECALYTSSPWQLVLDRTCICCEYK